MADLDKAKGFHDQRNWVQSLRYGELAATKLKQLKDRRLETVQAIDAALGCKYDALQFMDRHREAMECKKECYTLWAMNHLRNPGSIKAALSLIQSCIHNKEFEDAERYARHAMFMINEMTDNFIPSDQRPRSWQMDRTILLKPYTGRQWLVASQQKKSRKQGRRRSRSHARRWRSALSCMGPRVLKLPLSWAYLPMCLTISTSLTTTKLFAIDRHLWSSGRQIDCERCRM